MIKTVDEVINEIFDQEAGWIDNEYDTNDRTELSASFQDIRALAALLIVEGIRLLHLAPGRRKDSAPTFGPAPIYVPMLWSSG